MTMMCYFLCSGPDQVPQDTIQDICKDLYKTIVSHGDEQSRAAVTHLRTVQDVEKFRSEQDASDDTLATARVFNHVNTYEAMEAWVCRDFGPKYGSGGVDQEREVCIHQDKMLMQHVSGLSLKIRMPTDRQPSDDREKNDFTRVMSLSLGYMDSAGVSHHRA
jgi:hypothetical protein